MTDNNAWRPPSGDPLPPAGQFVPPASPYGPPTQQPVQQAQQAPGWTPPPKPGLIPLRPLAFGTLLGASFQVIRRNPRPTFGISLLLNGLVIVLFVGVIGGVTALAFGRAASATSADADEIEAGAIGAIVVSALIPIALSLLVTAILQGIISLEVSRATIGEKLTVRGLWRLARGRIGALVGWSALVTAAILVAIVILALIVTLLIVLGGDAGLVIGIILGIIAGLGSIVVWAWLATKLSLVPSVLMLERLPLRRAVTRSWRLTSGYSYFWKALGTQLLVYVIVQVAAQVVATPISILAAVGGSTINPNGDMTASVVVLVVGYILTGIVSLVFGALAAVAQSAVAALIYIDFRMRKEGLDLDLARFVEARQVGDIGVANPYLRTS
ncbi:hypothetical protein [Conyzicola sp.]|uniref:hypothetical protein n=1 Tax=Conyzicola sp. TaxID=1969404 RepID=UPI003988F054